jgi:uncharacterized membrane protein YqgA involved in biofilm formation
MKFIGTLVDVLAIIVGAGFGMIYRGKLSVAYQRIILMACGLAAVTLGAFGIYDSLFIFSKEQVEIKGSMLILFALVTGTVLGGGFGISRLLSRLGRKIEPAAAKEEQKDMRREENSRKKRRLAIEKGERSVKPGKTYIDELPRNDISLLRFESRHVEGFVMATVLLAFGCFAITGPYNDGMGISTTQLYIKAGFDGVVALALSLVYGSAVSYAAIPVAIIDLIMTVLAMLWGNALSVAFGQMAVISSVIMLAAGLCIALGKKFKVENMIPSLLIPPIYYGVIVLAEKLVGV